MNYHLALIIISEMLGYIQIKLILDGSNDQQPHNYMSEPQNYMSEKLESLTLPTIKFQIFFIISSL